MRLRLRLQFQHETRRRNGGTYHRAAGPEHDGGSSDPIIPRPLYARIILPVGKVMSSAVTAHVVRRLAYAEGKTASVEIPEAARRALTRTK
jgi:hypothetical protein